MYKLVNKFASQISAGVIDTDMTVMNYYAAGDWLKHADLLFLHVIIILRGKKTYL